MSSRGHSATAEMADPRHSLFLEVALTVDQCTSMDQCMHLEGHAVPIGEVQCHCGDDCGDAADSTVPFVTTESDLRGNVLCEKNYIPVRA